MSSFPSTPQAVVATSSRGAETRAALAQDGSFTLTLAKGDSYALVVETANGRVPIAMPRTSGKLDKSFVVGSNGVAIALGAVHYRPANAPSTIVAQAATCNPDGTGDHECVQDDGQSSCESDDQGDGDGETHDDGNDNAEQLDVKVEMAIPAHSAPVVASGCESND